MHPESRRSGQLARRESFLACPRWHQLDSAVAVVGAAEEDFVALIAAAEAEGAALTTAADQDAEPAYVNPASGVVSFGGDAQQVAGHSIGLCSFSRSF